MCVNRLLNLESCCQRNRDRKEKLLLAILKEAFGILQMLAVLISDTQTTIKQRVS